VVDRPFLTIMLFFVLLVGAAYSIRVHKHCGTPGANNGVSASQRGEADVTETTCHWIVSWRW
jgi:hypothetical protein